MEIIQKNNAEDGLFIAQDGETKMGYIQYEWFEPKVLGLMHTVVRPEFRDMESPKPCLTQLWHTHVRKESLFMPFARMPLRNSANRNTTM